MTYFKGLKFVNSSVASDFEKGFVEKSSRQNPKTFQTTLNSFWIAFSTLTTLIMNGFFYLIFQPLSFPVFFPDFSIPAIKRLWLWQPELSYCSKINPIDFILNFLGFRTLRAIATFLFTTWSYPFTLLLPFFFFNLKKKKKKTVAVVLLIGSCSSLYKTPNKFSLTLLVPGEMEMPMRKKPAEFHTFTRVWKNYCKNSINSIISKILR